MGTARAQLSVMASVQTRNVTGARARILSAMGVPSIALRPSSPLAARLSHLPYRVSVTTAMA
jgi:hypothetical protein